MILVRNVGALTIIALCAVVLSVGSVHAQDVADVAPQVPSGEDPGDAFAGLSPAVEESASGAVSPISPLLDQTEVSSDDDGGKTVRIAAAADAILTLPEDRLIGDIAEIRAALSPRTLRRAAGEPTVRVLVTTNGNGDDNFDAVKSAVADTGTLVLAQATHFPVIELELTSRGLDALVESDVGGGIELDRELTLDLASTKAVTGADRVNVQGLTGGGSAVTSRWEVAIIDSGVRSDHTGFGGRVVSQACYTRFNACPNGTSTMIGAGAGEPCSTLAGCFHGTHVAGIAASQDANGQSGGTASRAGIIAIQVFEPNTSNTDITTWTSSLVRALDFVAAREAAGNRVAAVNMSLGGGEFPGSCDATSSAMTTAATTLRSAGVAVIASAGNSFSQTTMGFPACITSVIAVGNTLDSDVVAASSSTSPEMDLWAPGSAVLSTGSSSNTAYVSSSGTSMSAPQVAGAFAVLYDCVHWFQNADAAPTNTADETVLSHILATGPLVADQRAGGVTVAPRLDVLTAASTWNDNNDFDNAEVLPGITGSNGDFTFCSDNESGEVSSGVGSTWYQWTAPSDGIATMSTCSAGTTADTTMHVYVGSGLRALTVVGVNDDDPSCTDHSTAHSTVTFDAAVGTTYRIRIAAKSSAPTSQGKFNINWDLSPYPTCNGLQATIIGTLGADVISGTPGNDVIVAGNGDDVVHGNGGDDTICLGSGDDQGTGGPGVDWMSGAAGNDSLVGNEGNDVLAGGHGDDMLEGNDDDDYLFGYSGHDVLAGGHGDDYLASHGGADQLDGGEGNDRLYGGPGIDRLSGGSGADVLGGHGGNDFLFGQLGEDKLSGHAGDDILDGGGDDDRLYGGLGADTLKGGSGSDVLLGHSGNDTLFGQSGNDFHSGGSDADICNGGAGADSAHPSCEVVTGIS